MPLNLGYDVARLVPALCLIAEAGVVTPHLKRWPPYRAFEQMSDLVLQDVVGRQPDCVACTLGFEEFVNLGIGEGCVTPEIQMLHGASITRDYRLEQRTPVVSTVNVARPQHTSLNVAKLVEHE